jgi:hypothetical protein
MLDWQYGFNILLGLVSACMGWILRMVHQEVRDLHQKQEHLAEKHDKLPETYVRKDDFKDFTARIEGSLIRIEHKLDLKTDKSPHG